MAGCSANNRHYLALKSISGLSAFASGCSAAVPQSTSMYPAQKKGWLPLGRFVGWPALDAGLGLQLKSRVHSQQHGPLPGVGGRSAGKLLHELAGDVEAGLPSGSPAAQQHGPRAVGHHSADREEQFVARQALADVFQRLLGGGVEAGQHDHVRPTPGQEQPVGQRAARLAAVDRRQTTSRKDLGRAAPLCRPAPPAAGTASRRSARGPAAAAARPRRRAPPPPADRRPRGPRPHRREDRACPTPRPYCPPRCAPDRAY